MNAKDYGVPQNRERCFMLSWLGDEFFYDFPDKIPLTKTLKDVLEKEVDEKYYLSDEAVAKMAITDETARGGYLPSKSQRPLERADEEASTDIVGILLSNQGKKFERRTDVATTLMARDYKGFGNQAMTGVLEWKK